MSTNSIASIKQDFARDHSRYLTSYINHLIRDIPADSVTGIRKLKTTRALLGEMVVKYPRIMAYMSNPKESNKIGVTLKSIKKEMAIQSGISERGEEEPQLEEMQGRIGDIHSMISRIKKIDLSSIEEMAVNIMADLETLRTNLQKVNKHNVNNVMEFLHPDEVLSNLLELRTYASTLIDNNGSLDKFLLQEVNKHPVRSFDLGRLQEFRTLLTRRLNEMVMPTGPIDDAEYQQILDRYIEAIRDVLKILYRYRGVVTHLRHMNDEVKGYALNITDGIEYGPIRIRLKTPDMHEQTDESGIFEKVTPETEMRTKLLAAIFDDEDLVSDNHRLDLSKMNENMEQDERSQFETIKRELMQMRKPDLSNSDRLQNIQKCMSILSGLISSAKASETDLDSLTATYTKNYNRIYSYFGLLTLIATDKSLADNFVYEYVDTEHSQI
jgi:Asp-tRNA(Asn)/Glu-tRNA(Gln) amidotransferase C subunit